MGRLKTDCQVITEGYESKFEDSNPYMPNTWAFRAWQRGRADAFEDGLIKLPLQKENSKSGSEDPYILADF